MTFRTYTDKAGERRWRLVASNGEKLADSGEGYKNETDLLAAIGLVKGCADAEVEEQMDETISTPVLDKLNAMLDDPDVQRAQCIEVGRFTFEAALKERGIDPESARSDGYFYIGADIAVRLVEGGKELL